MCFVDAWRPPDTVKKSANFGCIGKQVDSASNLRWQFCTAEKFEYEQQQIM